VTEKLNEQPVLSYPMIIWSDGQGLSMEWHGGEDSQCPQELLLNGVE
jgi:hypothetical protein